MPVPIFFPADFQLSIESAECRCNDIAAQDTEPLPCLYQFLVGECSDKSAVIVFSEFTEPDRTGHRSTDNFGVQRKGRTF
jgi:hypothetical protein